MVVLMMVGSMICCWLSLSVILRGMFNENVALKCFYFAGGGGGLDIEIQNQSVCSRMLLYRTVFGPLCTFNQVAVFKRAAALSFHMLYEMNVEHVLILRRRA